MGALKTYLLPTKQLQYMLSENDHDLEKKWKKCLIFKEQKETPQHPWLSTTLRKVE